MVPTQEFELFPDESTEYRPGAPTLEYFVPGSPALPLLVYFDHYIGNCPVSLKVAGEVLRDGLFVMDPLTQLKQYGCIADGPRPLTAILVNGDQDDARHTPADSADWGLLNAKALVHRYFLRRPAAGLDGNGWSRIVELSTALLLRLNVKATGNHFFFVGEAGARATAHAIEEGIQRLILVEADLNNILASSQT